MWNEVIIGESANCGSAYPTGYPGISRAMDSFWFSEESNHLGVTGRINYSTTQGESLRAYIKDGYSAELVKDAITGWIMKEITTSKLITAIDKLQQSAYDEGRRDLQIEFKNLLGVQS